MPSHSSIDSAMTDQNPDSLDGPVDILVLSNGPGEVSTWVRPVVQSLRQHLGNDRDRVRISLILSPCPNASGKEVAIARRYEEIDRIQSADHFFPFLLFGKTVEQWDWRHRGVVVFLGGDQLFPIIIGKRLGYRTVIYGEWDTRWHQWGDRYAAMNQRLVDQSPERYRDKFTVVGDLMADIGSSVPSQTSAQNEATESPATSKIALLPGSKAAKLGLGVPFCLAIAAHIQAERPDIQFVIPVAPTLELKTLESYACPETNSWCTVVDSPVATLVTAPLQPSAQVSSVEHKPLPYLNVQSKDRQSSKERSGNVQSGIEQSENVQADLLNSFPISLYQNFPAYGELQNCALAITTVGANTAELGALGVPMIVILPTQQIDAMRAWDGLPGLLANLPGVGRIVATGINLWFLRKKRLLAWPNIWAKAEIVPEMVGRLDPHDIAAKALGYLEQPDSLVRMRQQLRAVRGNAGAGDRISRLVIAELMSFEDGIQ